MSKRSKRLKRRANAAVRVLRSDLGQQSRRANNAEARASRAEERARVAANVVNDTRRELEKALDPNIKVFRETVHHTYGRGPDGVLTVCFDFDVHAIRRGLRQVSLGNPVPALSYLEYEFQHQSRRTYNLIVEKLRELKVIS